MAKKKKNKNKQLPSFRIKKRWSFAGLSLVIMIIFVLSVLLHKEEVIVEEKKQGFHLIPASFDELPGFKDDNVINAKEAMLKSCSVVKRRNLSYYADNEQWVKVCDELNNIDYSTNPAFRRFIRNNFLPYKVTFNGEAKGLFTGYYIPLLKGSRVKTKKYDVPIYAKPKDIVEVDVAKFYPNCKNCKIIGLVKNNKLEPYHARKAIDSNDMNADVLVWIDDAVDSFILHIQGSGKVIFPDGVKKTIGFAGFNGHKFVGIGSLMIKEKLIKSGDYSMPSIKKWLKENPKKAKELMWKNPRYIFFHELTTEPVGGQGVPLTPRRSLAIDTKFISYGVPIWLDTMDSDKKPLQRLMIAQDTGGAINGAVRGDFFWGEGDEAFNQAGRMKRKGEYYVLLPKENHFTSGKLEKNKEDK